MDIKATIAKQCAASLREIADLIDSGEMVVEDVEYFYSVDRFTGKQLSSYGRFNHKPNIILKMVNRRDCR